MWVRPPRVSKQHGVISALSFSPPSLLFSLYKSWTPFSECVKVGSSRMSAGLTYRVTPPMTYNRSSQRNSPLSLPPLFVIVIVRRTQGQASIQERPSRSRPDLAQPSIPNRPSCLDRDIEPLGRKLHLRSS